MVYYEGTLYQGAVQLEVVVGEHASERVVCVVHDEGPALNGAAGSTLMSR